MRDSHGKLLRGEAAWQAAKQGVAKRNDAARARAAATQAASEARRIEAARAAERAESANLPEQPHPDPSPFAGRPPAAASRRA